MENRLSKKVRSLTANGYSFYFGNYISEGFNMFGKFAGGFIGYCILLFFMLAFMGVIPVLGNVASFVLSPPLIAGLYIVARKIRRGESVEFGNFFDGFKIEWIQLVLLSLITSAFALAICIPLIPMFIAQYGILQEIQLEGSNELPSLDGLAPWMLAYGFVAILALIYISNCWRLATMHVIFQGAKAWEALEASRKIVNRSWWIWFLFAIVTGLIAGLGLIGLVVGLLITMPAMLCANVAAYSDVMRLDDDDDHEEMDETSHFIV